MTYVFNLINSRTSEDCISIWALFQALKNEDILPGPQNYPIPHYNYVGYITKITIIMDYFQNRTMFITVCLKGSTI